METALSVAPRPSVRQSIHSVPLIFSQWESRGNFWFCGNMAWWRWTRI